MQRRLGTFAACIALAVIAALGAGPAAAAPGLDGEYQPDLGEAVAAATVQTDANASVSLDRSIVRVESGEETTMELTFDGTDEATVVVGGGDAHDNVTITVTDTNGDGVVPLVFDAGPIGTMATRFVPVNDSDDYGTVNASEYGGLLPAGEYPIEVYVGHGISGEPTDVGTLVVNGTTTPEPTTEPPATTAPPEASIDYGGDAVTLHPRAGQVIEGTADLDAGRTVTVRLRSSGESPFLLSNESTVGADGSFRAGFNLSGVEAPANATAVVTVDGDRIAGPVDVAVVEAPATSGPGQPGFGAVAALLAVVAVAAQAVGARRRR